MNDKSVPSKKKFWQTLENTEHGQGSGERSNGEHDGAGEASFLGRRGRGW